MEPHETLKSNRRQFFRVDWLSFHAYDIASTYARNVFVVVSVSRYNCVHYGKSSTTSQNETVVLRSMLKVQPASASQLIVGRRMRISSGGIQFREREVVLVEDSVRAIRTN